MSTCICFQLWAVISIALVMTSLVILAIDTLPALREVPGGELNFTGIPAHRRAAYFYYNTLPVAELVYLDFTVSVLLLLEFILRFISCPRKIYFLKSLENALFFFSLLPTVTTSGLYFIKDDGYAFTDSDSFRTFMDIFRPLRALRVVCLLRYGQYFSAVRVVMITVRYSIRPIGLILLLLLALSLFYGTLMFHAELDRGTFPTIPLGVWWAIVTITTIGYGDFFPTSTAGYIIASVCTITGLIVITLPIAIISMNFNRHETAMSRIIVRKHSIKSIISHEISTNRNNNCNPAFNVYE